MPATGSIEIRSYRTVFDLERRIYRIDRIRLNPGGIPLRGVLYGVLLAITVVLAGRLPLCRELLTAFPWFVRDLAVPVGGAALLSLVRVDGRPFHRAAGAFLRFATSRSRLVGLTPYRSPGPLGRWQIPDLLVLCDGSEGRLRRLRFDGPGAVLVAVEHERGSWSTSIRSAARLELKALATGRTLANGVVIDLARGARLEIGASKTRVGAGAARSRG